MPRKLNSPTLVYPNGSPPLPMRWAFFDNVFPEWVCTILDITTHPDPFTPKSNRVCHHACVQLGGLGVVDLGWCITGEPVTEPCVVAILVDPGLMFALRDDFTDSGHERNPAGYGVVARVWNAYYHVARLTALSLAVKVCEDSTRHRATDALIDSARNARRAANGMVVEWPGYSGVKLDEV